MQIQYFFLFFLSDLPLLRWPSFRTPFQILAKTQPLLVEQIIIAKHHQLHPIAYMGQSLVQEKQSTCSSDSFDRVGDGEI